MAANFCSSSSSIRLQRKSTPKTIQSAASFFVGDLAGADENHHHFLDSCALCCKPLRPNDDIFMYKGNTPFCSEECRLEQITLDEFAEKSRRRGFNMSKTSSSDTDGSRATTMPVNVRRGAVLTV